MPIGINLKDCPFCGATGKDGKLIYDTAITLHGKVGFVECCKCGTMIRAKNAGVTVRKWNRRTIFRFK